MKRAFWHSYTKVVSQKYFVVGLAIILLQDPGLRDTILRKAAIFKAGSAAQGQTHSEFLDFCAQI